MSKETMMVIYYALFHSTITYGIPACPTQKILLQRMQNKVFKIINKNNFVTEKIPCNLDQQYYLEALMYNYKAFKQKFTESQSKTRKKRLQLPKTNKASSSKSSIVNSMFLFNSL